MSANAARRIEQLRSRIVSNARYQESEDPAEDAAAPLTEAGEVQIVVAEVLRVRVPRDTRLHLNAAMRTGRSARHTAHHHVQICDDGGGHGAHTEASMKKIISLFKRDYDGTRLVYDEVVPGAEWVIAGQGTPTRKWDGTCVLIQGGAMWKRFEMNKGKTPPPGFVAAQDPDQVTGKQTGWIPVGDGPEDRWHREALINNDADAADYPDGTYELVGPKVGGNPDGFDRHTLVRHGETVLNNVPRTFAGIREYLERHDLIEGIVWHRTNGDMVKIKARDFGLKRGRTARPAAH
jgi:hypothetical protein